MNVTLRKNAPPPSGHVFQPTGTLLELFQDIIRTNLLNKLHEDWTINVASRVLTRFYFILGKNVSPPGGHVFQPTGTNFELIQDIIGTNLLNKFKEDRTINAHRVSTSQLMTPHDGQNALTKAHQVS
ncbi:hypothetical protein DPMN_031574 [Dreissena polymorpha]|uniref:Uncharacterized protein n=1 Tax=Dreissena polymorpha TaxID=45954 RepID=A0A9D4RJ83_DREPO|nr:hypothetical protein DPMN_031574 [Dreissena polymorpha]